MFISVTLLIAEQIPSTLALETAELLLCATCRVARWLLRLLEGTEQAKPLFLWSLCSLQEQTRNEE